MTSKACRKCGEVKPLDEYHRKKTTKDGRRAECKACVRAYKAEHYKSNKSAILAQNAAYYAAHHETIRARQAEYQSVNRESISLQKAEYRARPASRAARADYYQANREHMLEANAKWRAENREYRERYYAEYKAANPHVGWESLYRLRAKQYGFSRLIPSMQSFTREDLTWLHGDACYHCGGEWNQLDHWPLAISQGGMHALFNAVPSCADCNQRSWRTAPTNNTTITEDRN